MSVFINPIYCDVCVLPSLQPTSDGESRIPPILLRRFYVMTVVAPDKDTVRVLQREDNTGCRKENGSQRVAQSSITTFGIVALHALHRFVCFPSFASLAHPVSDCYRRCRSSLHFTPLSTFPDVDCSLSNHDSPSRCIAPSICADTTTRVLRSHVTSSFCSTLHHSCPFRSSRLSNGLVWSDAQPQNPIASLLLSTRSGVLVR